MLRRRPVAIEARAHHSQRRVPKTGRHGPDAQTPSKGRIGPGSSRRRDRRVAYLEHTTSEPDGSSPGVARADCSGGGERDRVAAIEARVTDECLAPDGSTWLDRGGWLRECIRSIALTPDAVAPDADGAAPGPREGRVDARLAEVHALHSHLARTGDAHRATKRPALSTAYLAGLIMKRSIRHGDGRVDKAHIIEGELAVVKDENPSTPGSKCGGADVLHVTILHHCGFKHKNAPVLEHGAAECNQVRASSAASHTV
mmetsp:Transcript_20860/g.53267  ORF Transcript_20860/g.53267 Transcript_20860/m.53267 type:complete len:257 (-) Transcript_20860:562-1332(-)